MVEGLSILVAAIVFTATVWGSYLVGYISADKNVDIAKLETERDMLKQRLIEFHKEDMNENSR